MVEYASKQATLIDLILLFYLFYHIPDPLDEKIRFLKLCKERLPRGGKLCIADVFIPEAIHKEELD